MGERKGRKDKKCIRRLSHALTHQNVKYILCTRKPTFAEFESRGLKTIFSALLVGSLGRLQQREVMRLCFPRYGARLLRLLG